MTEQNNYGVVFEYTPEAGAYAGNRYRVSYRDKAHFEEMNNDINKKLKVIAENVSDSESLRLCREVPARPRIRAAIKESLDENGVINPEILKFEIANALGALKGSEGN